MKIDNKNRLKHLVRRKNDYEDTGGETRRNKSYIRGFPDAVAALPHRWADDQLHGLGCHAADPQQPAVGRPGCRHHCHQKTEIQEDTNQS